MARKIRFSTKLKKSLSEGGAFLKKNKIYAAAFLVLGIAGGASVLLLGGSSEEPEQVQRMETYVLPTHEAVEIVTKSDDETLSQVINNSLLQRTSVPTLIPDFTPAYTSKPAAKTEKFIAPTDGEIIWGYAVDNLIYSRTLSQWMTHSGVDIASPKSSEVYAIAGGCVENVYTDDLLGVSVVLVHDDGMMSVYANLKEEPPVKAGQLVEKRDVIGYIGNTAISECKEESHLHFEFYKGDKTVNPEDYIRFDKINID